MRRCLNCETELSNDFAIIFHECKEDGLTPAINDLKKNIEEGKAND